MGSENRRADEPAPRGAYGLRVGGVSAAPRLLVPAGEDWPELTLHVGEPPDEPPPRAATATVRFVDGGARLYLSSSGYVDITRTPVSATFRFPQPPSPDAVAHPYLGGIASLVGRWLGRETIHAGAFLMNGDAWAVVGGRQAGKSSLLAGLASRGWDVLCDDMVVIDGDDVFAGPRTIDLRPDAAAEFREGELLGIVGARERWRVVLPPPPTTRAPLRGWIFLSWGDSVQATRLRPADVLSRLVAQTAIPGAATDPAGMLRLAALHGVELRRPPEWAAVDEVVDRLRIALST